MGYLFGRNAVFFKQSVKPGPGQTGLLAGIFYGFGPGYKFFEIPCLMIG